MTDSTPNGVTKSERPLILRIIYFCLIGWWWGSIWTLLSALIALSVVIPFIPGNQNFLNFDSIPTMFSKVKTMYFL
jgi:hypothetical protein